MALMTDKRISKILENRLNEVSEYGMTLYYLLEEGRTSIKDLESILFSSDEEKSCFTYSSVLKHIDLSDLTKSYEKYSLEKDNDNEEYKKELNIEYTKKIIDIVISKSNSIIDKTYVNTYNYLLANISNK